MELDTAVRLEITTVHPARKRRTSSRQITRSPESASAERAPSVAPRHIIRSGEVQQVVFATDKVIRFPGYREINVWLIFRIAGEHEKPGGSGSLPPGQLLRILARMREEFSDLLLAYSARSGFFTERSENIAHRRARSHIL